jgi:hypothetical protein
LDALNVHAYSWLETTAGKSGIYPEHKLSSLHGLNAWIRFRDAVAPKTGGAQAALDAEQAAVSGISESGLDESAKAEVTLAVREATNDILRQMLLHPDRIRVCPCVTDVWIRKTLEFLGAIYSNEPSCERVRSEPNRELAPPEKS